MKITKKAFIDAMTSNLTIFCGNTKQLLPEENVHSFVKKLIDNYVHYEPRSCTARSKDLMFSNGSYLSFNQVGSYEFHKYEFPEGVMCICCHNYHDDFDNNDYVNAMYYFID